MLKYIWEITKFFYTKIIKQKKGLILLVLEYLIRPLSSLNLNGRFFLTFLASQTSLMLILMIRGSSQTEYQSFEKILARILKEETL